MIWLRLKLSGHNGYFTLLGYKPPAVEQRS